ncbi:MAG: LysR family transcriptional regulator [Desulfosarcinaceae bacterium]
MNLQQLRTFRTVATLMNFNQAARLLNYAQSSISAQIKTLEMEVGRALFNRQGKKIELTTAGEKMLKYAHKILAIEAEALAEINGKADTPGLLSLRMPQTIATCYLPSVLRDFSRRFPGIHLDVSSCAFYALEHELSIGTVDLAFLLTDTISAADLDFELLAVEPLSLVASPDHPLAKQDRVTYADLQGETLLLPKADCGYRMAFERTLTEKNITPSALIELNTIDAIKKIVMLGMGVTIIPTVAIGDELAQNKLVLLAWEDDLETGVLMIWHQDKWFSNALTAFMEGFRKILSQG